MIKNATLLSKCISMLTFLFLTFSLNAQILPKLKFRQPVLISGTDGKVNANYLFKDVMEGVDAYIQIENIVNGAFLVNVDESALGYNDAWQPTVSGNGSYGSSYIKWYIRFKDKAGDKYTFPILNATAIDIDGDNVRVREFIGVNGQSGYSVPSQVPTLLNFKMVDDTDNINNDASPQNLIALGPVTNRADIDTLTQDVRLNLSFENTDGFHIYTGSQVDNNGNNGAIATSRYHSIYFMKIEGDLKILPVSYRSFTAVAGANAVNLNWSFDAEVLDREFEVQRSYDQSDFSTVAFVLGSDPSHTNSGNYSFKDESADFSNNPVVYYRLKLLESDGGYSYSSIKMVRASGEISSAFFKVRVMPNPYMDKINVNFTSNENGTSEITLSNTAGIIIKRINKNIVKGYNTFQIQDLAGHASGMYLLNVVINGRLVQAKKIIKN